MWRLQEAGISVAVNYRAVHLLTYYRERFGFEARTSFQDGLRQTIEWYRSTSANAGKDR